MSKQPDEKQPWEQPIYETEYETNSSRSEKRTGNKGNIVFMSILVLLLVAIAAILVYIFVIATKGDVAEPPKEPS